MSLLGGEDSAMNRRALTRGTLIGIAVGAAVGLVMTTVDYVQNPAGVFHNEQGVHWGNVAETWVSWFVPVALIGSMLSVAVVWWISRSSIAR